jgi:hypothetical protein
MTIEIETDIANIDRSTETMMITILVDLSIEFADGHLDAQATVTFTQAYDDTDKLKRWDMPRVDLGGIDAQYGQLTRAEMGQLYAAALDVGCDWLEGNAQDL